MKMEHAFYEKNFLTQSLRIAKACDSRLLKVDERACFSRSRFDPFSRGGLVKELAVGHFLEAYVFVACDWFIQPSLVF